MNKTIQSAVDSDMMDTGLVSRYAERLARREILSGLVTEGHPVLEQEKILVRESEGEVSRLLSSRPGKAVAHRLTALVLSRAAAYLRSYGCPRRDIGGRVGRIRPALELAVGSSPFSASSAA